MIHCLLNDEDVRIEAEDTGSVLTWLREQRGLTGAKHACGEGGCGACAILLGHRDRPGGLRYRVVDSCLLPLGALSEAHVVTVEGLAQVCDGVPANGAATTDHLGPVQAALVEESAVQCGFCTPGLVIGLTAYLLNGRLHSDEAALEAIDGHLCRCTGYMGIKRAAQRLRFAFQDLPADSSARRDALIARGVLPTWFTGVAERLANLPPAAPRPARARIVAGGTDLFSRSFSRSDSDATRQPAWFVEHDSSLSGVSLESGHCRIGAGTTIEELLESDALAEALPHVHGFLAQISATPIRDRATVGGNLVNASPIADLAICLLALEASLTLVGDSVRRVLPLAAFYLGYKRVAMRDDELIESVEFPLHADHILFNFEKVGHRRTLDIAAVNSAMRLERDGARIECARISAGGVGPIPRLLTRTSEWLTGRPIDAETVREAAYLAMQEAAPIDDVHGSADYKRALLGRLVQAHFLALAPDLGALDVAELQIRGDGP